MTPALSSRGLRRAIVLTTLLALGGCSGGSSSPDSGGSGDRCDSSCSGSDGGRDAPSSDGVARGSDAAPDSTSRKDSGRLTDSARGLDSSGGGDAATNCGDGVLDGSEKCDGKNLAGATCKTLGFAGGTLACLPDCSAFDESGCFNTCDTSTLDIQTATVKGTVTLDGATWPKGGLSGNDYHHEIVFVREDTKTELPVFIQTGGAYSARIVEGTYDILFRGNESDIYNVTYSQDVSLATGVVVQGPLQKSFDIATATVSGTVTLDGADWPDGGITGNDYDHEIDLVRTDTKTELPVFIAAAGAYTARVVQGTYDILFRGNESDIYNVTYSQDVSLATGVVVQGPLQKSFDIATATVGGTVTLDGADWPDGGITGNDYDHEIDLVRTDTKTEFPVFIAAGGAYTARVVQGTYDVLFRGNESDIYNVTYSQDVSLATGVVVQGPLQKSFDIATATVGGTVTLDGADWPDGGITGNDYDHEIDLVRTDTKTEFPVFIAAGGAYTARVVQGTYYILFRGNESDIYNVTYSQDVNLEQGTSVQAPLQKSFDIATATVSGTVTLDGADWPDGGVTGNDYDHEIDLVRTDTKTEFPVFIAAGGAYTARVVQGTYDILFRGNESDIYNVTYSQDVNLEQGTSVQPPLQKSFDIATATVSGTVTLDGATWPTGGITGKDYDHADRLRPHRHEDRVPRLHHDGGGLQGQGRQGDLRRALSGERQRHRQRDLQPGRDAVLQLQRAIAASSPAARTTPPRLRPRPQDGHPCSRSVPTSTSTPNSSPNSNSPATSPVRHAFRATACCVVGAPGVETPGCVYEVPCGD